MERKKRSLQDRVDGVYKAGMSRRPKRAVFVIVALALLYEGSAPRAAHAQSPVCGFPAGYPGELAPAASIAAWMAARATAVGLPPELPVMASLVESGLQNLNFGDADSVGFFQMRTSSANGLMRHCDRAPAAAVTSSGSTTRVS